MGIVAELRAERHRMIGSLERLTDEEFENGATLCSEWSPRDVLAHVIGIDYFLGSYHGVLKGDPRRLGSRINEANEAQAALMRKMPRAKLMRWAATWADHPPVTTRLGAPILLGDLGVHHQDVLRGLGRSREVPPAVASAIYREGLQLSVWLNRRSLRHRLVPSDGGRAVGRGPEVHGTREALGMWLAGRDTVADELIFSS